MVHPNFAQLHQHLEDSHGVSLEQVYLVIFNWELEEFP